MDEKLIYEEETYAIRGAIFEVYKTLGDGYLEEVYQNAMEEELTLRGIPCVAKKELHIMYKGRDCGLYMPDLICFGKIIVELLCCAQHKHSYVGLKNMLGSRFAPAKAA